MYNLHTYFLDDVKHHLNVQLYTKQYHLSHISHPINRATVLYRTYPSSPGCFK
ncbi:MAG: hypothetical protein Sylvanvirus8_16 [Sylvanvirus sp.]|uniref:Uncharacterized protein n=1 Tax=Sylvanvirus sp. TaxID=2487774 RepID=A0A3G5AHV9_9VIRU|nr:MAG: hypothetical protein Sylvanvirus8_16 [Sylvanvirus sp.]